MRKVVALTFILWLLVLPTNASADGNDLLRNCKKVEEGPTNITVEDALHFGNCIGLMEGITNLNQVYAYAAELPKDRLLFCLPENGIKNGQAARVVVKYLEDNPSKLHNEASLLAIRALMSAYPCR